MSTLKEVDITPCPQAAEKKPCQLKRGTEETIEVKFTPSKNCLLFFSLIKPGCFRRSTHLEKVRGARGKHVRRDSLVRPLPTLSKQ